MSTTITPEERATLRGIFEDDAKRGNLTIKGWYGIYALRAHITAWREYAEALQERDRLRTELDILEHMLGMKNDDGLSLFVRHGIGVSVEDIENKDAELETANTAVAKSRAALAAANYVESRVEEILNPQNMGIAVEG